MPLLRRNRHAAGTTGYTIMLIIMTVQLCAVLWVFMQTKALVKNEYMLGIGKS